MIPYVTPIGRVLLYVQQIQTNLFHLSGEEAETDRLFLYRPSVGSLGVPTDEWDILLNTFSNRSSTVFFVTMTNKFVNL